MGALALSLERQTHKPDVDQIAPVELGPDKVLAPS